MTRLVGRSKKRCATHCHMPRVEILEQRQLPSTCYVTLLTDQGAGNGSHGDLRYSRNRANDLPGADTISFSAEGTVELTGAVPDLSSDINIRGPGVGSLVIRRNTEPLYRIFTVPLGVTVSVSGLTIL